MTEPEAALAALARHSSSATTQSTSSVPLSADAAGVTVAAPSSAGVNTAEAAAKSSEAERDEHHLVYSKSKVYVHPTPYAKDNVPGYVALVRKGPPTPGSPILLAYLPESLLSERYEVEKFVRVECRVAEDDEGSSPDAGGMMRVEGVEVEDRDSVLISAPPSASEMYAFSVPLSSVYSLIIQPPTISCWYGTLAISLKGGLALPTLHFHDDESRSTMLTMERKSRTPVLGASRGEGASWTSSSSGSSSGDRRSSPVVSHGLPPTWGGDELLQQLRRYAHVHRSVIEPALFLVNPSRQDLETHSTPLFDDDAIDPPAVTESPARNRGFADPDYPEDPFDATGRGRRSSALHQSLPSGSSGRRTPGRPDATMDPLVSWAKSTRFNVLSHFSQLTQQARHATHQVLSHPLARPYVPRLPGPVQSFAQAGPIGPQEMDWGRISSAAGTGEYDSARVYLAKWARLVAEEGERNRRREERLGDFAHGEGGEEGGELGVFELLAQTADVPRPKPTRTGRAMSHGEWRSLFDSAGSLLHSESDVRARIFRSGLEPAARPDAWAYLLDAIPWDSNTAEREALWAARAAQYWTQKRAWKEDPAVCAREDVVEQRHRIRVDCLRTDRGQALFAAPPRPPTPPGAANGDADADASASSDAESPKAKAKENKHVGILGEILLTYGFWEGGQLGYVQGMSDLCAPLYVVQGADEVRTFWCFVGVMERMKSNFLRDQSGMKKQLLLLQQLINIMDPALYHHFEKTDALNLFFCFRWLLVAFKREFRFDDVLTLWEASWAAERGLCLSSHFSLFVALAVLESHRDVLLRYLENFDEMLQYMNGLSQQMDVESTIAQAEVLCRALHALAQQKDNPRTNSNSAAPRLPPLSDEMRELIDETAKVKP